MTSHDEKKALVMITGASSGIGREAAKVFSKAGYPLLLIARRLDKLEELNLSNSICVSADVRDYDSIVAAVKKGEQQFGPVDLLINNAGISKLARVEDQDPKEWRNLVDINIIGVLNSMHAVLPAMKQRRCGTIINMSSLAGRKVYAYHDVYGGTKHFVHAITEGARMSASQCNVRLMVMAPGVTKTNIEETITDKAAYDYWSKGRDEMGGGIEAESLAKLMLFAYQLPQDTTLREMTIAATAQEY